MKDFIVVSLILLVLFGTWLGFLYYSGQQIQTLTSDIENKILPAIEAEDWQKSSRLMKDFQDRWKKFRKISLYFDNAGPLSEIDISVSRTIKYVQAEDLSNSTGELQAASRQLSTLRSQEKLSLQNIF